MRLLIGLILLGLPLISSAIEVSCYSSGKLMYQGNVHKVIYDYDHLFFTEYKTNNEIVIFNGDCMFKAITKKHNK